MKHKQHQKILASSTPVVSLSLFLWCEPRVSIQKRSHTLISLAVDVSVSSGGANIVAYTETSTPITKGQHILCASLLVSLREC